MINKNKIKYLKQLQQKRYRNLEDKFIAEGIKIADEAIEYHLDQVIEIICTDSWAATRKNLPENKVKITNYETICKISSLSTPQEALVVLKQFNYDISDFHFSNDLLLVLENIKDPGNLGTIIRLADWFGIEHIVCSANSVDCYNPKVVQATMGAILRTKFYYTDLEEFIKRTTIKKIPVYGATLEGKNIYQTEMVTPSIVIMGNESEGISSRLRKYLNQEIFIPNFSGKSEKTESLNVSTATAIFLSEIRRRTYSK